MKKLILAATIIAASALAQRPGGTTQTTQPQFTELTTYLSLSATQLTALTTLRTTTSQALEPLRTQMAAKQRELRQQTAAGANATTLGAILTEIQNIQKQIDQKIADYRTQAIAGLTADQKTKVKALEDAAKLLAPIGQAASLNLIAIPADAQGGPGFGRFGRRPPIE